MTTKLSDTQAQILSATAQHEAQLAKAPQGLPAAARNAVFRSMLKGGLLEEMVAPDEHRGVSWRQAEDGAPIVLRLPELGLDAIGAEAKVEAPVAAGEAAAAAHGATQQQAIDPAHYGPVGLVQPPLTPVACGSLR
jgi:hypothetical protein